VGRGPRAAPLAVALGFGATPSRSAARRGDDVHSHDLALRCSPQHWRLDGRPRAAPPPPFPTPTPCGRERGGPPSRDPATGRPPHSTTQEPVGRRPRAAPRAVALVFGRQPSRYAARRGAPTPSRCAARRSVGVRTDALALPCSPSGIDPGAGSRSLECLAVQCP